MRILFVSMLLATSFIGVLSAPRSAQSGVLEDAEFAGILSEVMYAATKCGKVASIGRLRILATLSGADIERVNRELSKAFQGKPSDPFIDKAAGHALNTIAADVKRRGQSAACKSLIDSAAPLGLYDD